MSWHLRKVLSPSKVLLTPHTLLTSPPLQSFALCAPLSFPVAGLGLRALFFSLLLSSSSQHHSTFLLPSISCQSSCAPVCTPTASFTPLSPHSLWAQQPGLAEKAGLLRGPALPETSDQPGEGEHGILSEKTWELSLLVSHHSSLRLYRFGGFHCSSRGQQELKVFRSYMSLYMVLSIVSAKYSQAKPGGDFSAVVRRQQPLHRHSPLPQSNADVRSHSPKSRMPVNPLFSHCQECEPGSLPFPLSGVHDSSF